MLDDRQLGAELENMQAAIILDYCDEWCNNNLRLNITKEFVKLYKKKHNSRNDADRFNAMTNIVLMKKILTSMCESCSDGKSRCRIEIQAGKSFESINKILKKNGFFINIDIEYLIIFWG